MRTCGCVGVCGGGGLTVSWFLQVTDTSGHTLNISRTQFFLSQAEQLAARCVWC